MSPTSLNDKHANLSEEEINARHAEKNAEEKK